MKKAQIEESLMTWLMWAVIIAIAVVIILMFMTRTGMRFAGFFKGGLG